MCLSMEVDVVAGAAIAVIAVDALRHNREGRTLPLALLPAIFSVHSFASALVWASADGLAPAAAGEAAAWLYMFIAFVLLPVYLPVSVLLIEPRGWRRNALYLVGGLGLLCAIDYLLPLLQGTATATACDFFIDYQVPGRIPFSSSIYVLATVGSLLLSGHRTLMLWGVVNAVAVAALAWWATAGLPSIWCFWAAVTSGFIAWFLRTWQPPPQHQETEHAALTRGTGGPVDIA